MRQPTLSEVYQICKNDGLVYYKDLQWLIIAVEWFKADESMIADLDLYRIQDDVLIREVSISDILIPCDDHNHNHNQYIGAPGEEQ